MNFPRYRAIIDTPGASVHLSEPTLEQVVQETVNAAIRAHKGNMSAAAKSLGVDRRTVYRMIDRYAATSIVTNARTDARTERE